MIATSLAWPEGTVEARGRTWRQLVDLVAQGRADHLGADVTDAVYARIAACADALGIVERRRVADRLVAGALPLRLATLLALAGEDAAGPARDPLRAGPGGDGDQIGALLARIDAFHSRPAVADAGFALTIDAGGRLHAADGASLDASVGTDARGVDGQAIGAWRARRPIVDARLEIAGGTHSGSWRLSADPLADGGYAGSARSPRPEEEAAPARYEPPDAALEEAVRVDRFDRAVARLRAPLAAVLGLGDRGALPSADAQRAAADVVERGLDLADAIDGFDLAREAADDGGLIEAAAVLARLHAALTPLAEARGVTLSFRIARALPPVDADPQAVERMFTRLVGATLALGRRGERLVARLGLDRTDGRRLALTLTRPGRIVGRDAATLADPNAAERLPDTPLLAMAFALRLVGRLAEEAGGALAIHDDRLVLSLPLRPPADALRGAVEASRPLE